MSEMEPENSSEPTEASGIGNELRRQREMRNVSLREISESTKISIRFLEAIENEEYDTLPAPVFTRGFLTEYSRFLGLDVEDIVGRYLSLVDQRKTKEDEEEEELNRRIHSGGMGLFEGGLLLGLVIVIVAMAAFYGFGGRSSEPESTVLAPEPDAVSVDDIQPVETPPEEESEGLAAERPMTLSLAATSDAWIVLWADGVKVMEDTLRAGDARLYEAEDEFRFETLGNAGGVIITLDGRMVPPLGRAGEVIQDRVFSRESLEDLE